ncbi:hypothetical protein L7F22_054210 [Adiantum nelumboides]|nr:hypothetical protein [Adiantum nelumboides]
MPQKKPCGWEIYLKKPYQIFCDSSAAIDSAKKPRQSEKLKHMNIAEHFIREQVENDVIKLIYVPTTVNAADGLTKELSQSSQRVCDDLAGLEYINS